jgi:hypothetical protein
VVRRKSIAGVGKRKKKRGGGRDYEENRWELKRSRDAKRANKKTEGRVARSDENTTSSELSSMSHCLIVLMMGNLVWNMGTTMGLWGTLDTTTRQGSIKPPNGALFGFPPPEANQNRNQDQDQSAVL